MLTETAYKALKAIEDGNPTFRRGASAMTIAVAVWGEDPGKQYLFTAVSNQGNGACAGKKAWLCAGSLMGKLIKQGLARKGEYGYYLTEMGRKAVYEYEVEKYCCFECI